METLKISALYNDKEKDGYIVIFGRPDALSEFSQLLNSVNAEAITYTLSDLPIGFWEDYHVVLKHLNLSPRSELMDIRYVEQTLYITGTRIKLGYMVRRVDSLVEAATQRQFYTHAHIDPFGYPNDLTPDSTPLIIRALAEDEI